MKKIIMLKALPAAGKSTWASEQVKKGGYVHISVDNIRDSIYGGWSQKREREVLKMRDAMIYEGLAQNRMVIVDATNLNPKHERRLREIAEETGARFEINTSFLEVSPEECIKRDLHRGEKAVGPAVIWGMYYKWLAPKTDPLKDTTKPRAVLCDIDGTLAIMSNRSPYDMTRVGEDTLDPFVGCIIDALYNYGIERDGTPYPKIIILSGRSEDAREATELWLQNNMIPYDELYMRKEGDRRKDSIVKEEIYHTYIEPKYAVLGVFDDRKSVVSTWQKLGLRVADMGRIGEEF